MGSEDKSKEELLGELNELRRLLRDFEQAGRRTREAMELSDALNRINTVIHSTLDFDTVMQRVIVEAATALNVDASSIGLLRDDYFIIKYVYNLPGEFVGLSFPAREIKGINYAASLKDAVAFNDARRDERLNLDLTRKYGIRSLMITPFIARGTVLGAMSFYCLSSPYRFSDVHIDFARKLAGSVSLAIENARLFEERKRSEEEMKRLAHHDVLTGLPNRMLFTDHLNLELSQARRNRKRLAVMFMDIDRFKEVNDTLGHTVGDQLLVEVARRLKSTVRESDTVARIGGDEFNILMADIDRAEDAGKIAKKIIASFREPFVVDHHMLNITTSLGISVYPDDGENDEILLKHADVALYHAKDTGRNNYRFYSPPMNIRSAERLLLEDSLHNMLERGELKLYYQPRLALDTRKMVCAEALMRWQHPELGLLSPAQFVPLAEETGLIAAIDERVLRGACVQNKAWQDSGYAPLCVAVNLSTRRFQQPDFPEFVSGVLKETGLHPGLLEIDVAEHTVMQKAGHTMENLAQLADMGVHTSIDNFGSGCSALGQLKKLPIRKLKIDRSLVRNLATDPDYKTIVNAVIALAHTMDMEVVAKGVETNDQLSFLHSIRCDELQGFLFSEPLPCERFERLIMLHR